MLTLTVAVCTWNRAPLLAQTLDSLARIEPGEGVRLDVLVVDNNSTDDTALVVAGRAGRLNLRRVVEPTQGLSHARNRALAEFETDLIAYIDDDVLLDARWVAELARVAREYPRAGVFGGPIDPWFPEAPDPVLAAVFSRLAEGFCGPARDLPEGELPPGPAIYGGNMCFRREAVLGRLFDPRLGMIGGRLVGGEELAFIDTVRAGGWAAVWCPPMRVRHYVDPTKMTFEYQKRRTRGSGREWVRLHPEEFSGGPTLLGAPRWLWRLLAATEARRLKAWALSSRQQHLEAARDSEYLRGIVLETRLMARDRGQPG